MYERGSNSREAVEGSSQILVLYATAGACLVLHPVLFPLLSGSPLSQSVLEGTLPQTCFLMAYSTNTTLRELKLGSSVNGLSSGKDLEPRGRDSDLVLFLPQDPASM